MRIRFLDSEKTRIRIKRLISQSREIKIGVYSARKSGLSYFTNDLSKFLKNGGSLSFLVGFRSSPDIFDELRKLENIKHVRIGLYNESTFHSKIYIFKLTNGSVTSIVGSSNMTGSAFSTNIEANLELENFSIPEKTYDRLFEESEKNQRTMEKLLKKWEKINSGINKFEKKLERKSREVIEGKSVTWLWEMLDRQLGRINDPDLQENLKSIWQNAEKKIIAKHHKKRTRNGKKAWLRYRLYFITRKVILESTKGLTKGEKTSLFRYIAEYSLTDSELRKKHFSTKAFLRRLISLIKRKELERSFTRALWSRRKYGRRLFRKIAQVLIQEPE